MENRTTLLITNTLLGGLLGITALLSWVLINSLHLHQQLIQDQAELRNVKYGMLNADRWVQQVSAIVDEKVQELELKGKERQEMKKALERILDTLITEADKYIRAQHTQGDWWDRTTGHIKEGLRNVVMDIDTVKAGIPEYADQILDELEKPDTRREIGDFLTAIVGDLASSTFSEFDPSHRQEILQRYGCKDSAACESRLNERLSRIDREANYLGVGVVLAVVLMLWVVFKTASPSNRLPWVLLSLSVMLLLACGVLTPMLEVEAQISRLQFVLMGHPVTFTDEVIYFQSKSVLDVVSILVDTHKADMVLVGVLLMTFSAIFPCLKLLASMLYVYNPRGLRQSRLVHFFSLKSSKWSMADVMVIAIFMAYIAFNGMISNQLGLISRSAASAGVEVLTTNGTSLQPGFYLFLAFCVIGLFVSAILESAFRRNG